MHGTRWHQSMLVPRSAKPVAHVRSKDSDLLAENAQHTSPTALGMECAADRPALVERHRLRYS